MYVLQFDNKSSLEKAEEYYNSLDYVNYVAHDFEVEKPFCSVDDEFNYTAECPSTINQNIDDVIKLLKKENAEFNEIKMAVLDSGIVRTKITNDRIDGEHTFVEGANKDGTSIVGTVQVDHGTNTARTIILNTLDHVRLYSYQVRDANGSSNYLYAISSVYLAVADGCKIINMGLAYYSNLEKDVKSWNDTINTATASGCICIPQMEEQLNTEKDKSEGLQHFIAKAKRLTHLIELTPEILTNLLKRLLYQSHTR